MTTQTTTNRRDFLKTTLLSGIAAWSGPWFLSKGGAAEATSATRKTLSHVALTTGNQRAEMAFQGLKAFEKSIAAAIGNKRVVIKPNNVA
ncbi:MAG: hypothetical protein ACREIC_13170, partial [Limisphaerales bacterium]